jgi:hypothetical protein
MKKEDPSLGLGFFVGNEKTNQTRRGYPEDPPQDTCKSPPGFLEEK